MKYFLLILFFFHSAYSQVSVSKIRDLEFGDVFAGDNVSVTPSSTNAASFKITASRFSDISIQFILPSELYSSNSQLNINFNGNCAGHSFWNIPYFATLFDPGSLQTVNTFFFKNIYVWIGGQINTNLSQNGGLYSGQLTVIVTRIY